MKAYSTDLRERVVAACDARDGTRDQIAARFSVSVAWIRDRSKLSSSSQSVCQGLLMFWFLVKMTR